MLDNALVWVDPIFWSGICCWKSYLSCETDFPISPADFQSVKVTHQALLLTVHCYFCPCDHWSDFQISYQYIRIQQNKLNFSLTFWCLSTSGSSVSVLCKIVCSWCLLIYQNPFFARKYPARACLSVEDILQPEPHGVCLHTAWRTLSKSFLECSGPTFLGLE